MVDDRGAAVAGFGDGGEHEDTSRGGGVLDVGAAGDDLLGDAHRGFTQRAAAGMAEERADVVDVALTAHEWCRAVFGDVQHREVAVGVERDHVGVDLRAVGREDLRVLLPRHDVRVRDDESGAAKKPVPSCTRSHAVPSTFTTELRDSLRDVGGYAVVGWRIRRRVT